MRKFVTNIVVEKDEVWLFEGKIIEKIEILQYFKKNLFEDDKGIFIKNQMKEKIEYGYITVKGYPLFIKDFDNKDFYLISETGENLQVTDVNFFLDIENKLFVMKKPHRFLKYKITIPCLMKLSDFLIKENMFQFHQEKCFITTIKKNNSNF